jgi:hypothetical protein
MISSPIYGFCRSSREGESARRCWRQDRIGHPAARFRRTARLDTHARNIGAIRLYKRLGYRVKTYFVSYSEPLDEDIDKVEMIKEFEPGTEPADPGTGEYGLYGM